MEFPATGSAKLYGQKQNKSDTVVIAQMFPVGWSRLPRHALSERSRDGFAREMTRMGAHVRLASAEARKGFLAVERKELGLG